MLVAIAAAYLGGYQHASRTKDAAVQEAILARDIAVFWMRERDDHLQEVSKELFALKQKTAPVVTPLGRSFGRQ